MYQSVIHLTFLVTQFVIEKYALKQNNRKKNGEMDPKKQNSKKKMKRLIPQFQRAKDLNGIAPYLII